MCYRFSTPGPGFALLDMVDLRQKMQRVGDEHHRLALSSEPQYRILEQSLPDVRVDSAERIVKELPVNDASAAGLR